MIAKRVGILLTAGITAVIAFYSMFSGFAPWDDEGFLLISLREYARGGILYDEVFSQYGPAYYQLLAGLFRVLGLEFTHVTGRELTLVVWVSVAALCALVTFRLTRRVSLAVVTQLLVFASLWPLRRESPHPGGLLCLLVTVVVFAGTYLEEGHDALVLVAIGVLDGLAVLTKVNVGGFAIASTLACLLALVRVPSGMRAARAVACVVILLVPLAPMKVLWQWPLVRTYAISVGASVLAVGVTHLATSNGRRAPARWLAIFVGSLAVTVVISVAAEIARGTTLAALVSGVVVEPMRYPTRYVGWAFVPATARRWGVVSLVGCLAYTVARARGLLAQRAAAAALGVLKVVAGVALWSPFIWVALFDPRVEYAAWLWPALAAPAVGAPEPRRLGKCLLVAIAALQTLHAYPVAGSQISWATFLFVPVGAVAIADGLALLRTSAESWGLHGPAFGTVLARASAAAMVSWFAWSVGYATLARSRAEYRAGVPLALAGAESIRVSAMDAALYQWLVGEIRARCAAFITMPGLNSLYLFTGMDPPTRKNVGGWPTFFGPAEQREIRDRFASLPGPRCVIRNVHIAAFWLKGRKPESPLADYVAEHFVTVARRAGGFLSGEYEFMVERTDSLPE